MFNNDNNNTETNGKYKEQGLYSQAFCYACGSPYRPPTYIAQNCSCSHLAAFANGGGTELNVRHDEQFGYDYTNPVLYHQPESFMTDKSALGQEGVENAAPNLETSNDLETLQLTSPTPGFNGTDKYWYSDLSFSMKRWLGSEAQDSQPPYDTRRSSHSSNQYLNHADHNPTPSIRKKNNKRKPSVQSGGSGETMVDSWTRETGGWVYSDGTYFEVTHSAQEGEGYPNDIEISGF